MKKYSILAIFTMTLGSLSFAGHGLHEVCLAGVQVPAVSDNPAFEKKVALLVDWQKNSNGDFYNIVRGAINYNDYIGAAKDVNNAPLKVVNVNSEIENDVLFDGTATKRADNNALHLKGKFKVTRTSPALFVDIDTDFECTPVSSSAVPEGYLENL